MTEEPRDPEEETFRRRREQLRARIHRDTDRDSLTTLLSGVDGANRRAGFLAWDPNMIAKDPQGDPGPTYPRLRPVSAASSRLFISYSWQQDQQLRTGEADHWADAFAGFLFGRGYDIVFDRDPRNLGKALSWFNILTRMNDCNYFVAILTERYLDRIASSDAGPGVAEWHHALKGYPDWFTFIGIWRSGDQLPPPFSVENTVDVRSADLNVPWSEPIARMFPTAADGARGRPLLPPPRRPPDPAHWPKYVPY